MSHPCLSVSSTFRRKCDSSRNDGKSPLQNKAKKRTRIAFDGIESMDASDYLSEVVREAKGMPDIFVDDTVFSKPNDEVAKESGGGDSYGQDLTTTRSQSNCASSIDGSAASLSYLLSRRASMTPPPSIRHLPKTENVKEWTESVVSNFERLRGYLERSKTQGFGGKLSARKPLPTMKDRSSWHIFCVGMDEASGNSGAYFADEYGDGDNNNVVKNKEERNKDDDKTMEELQSWRTNLPADGYEPSVCLLLQMDQVMIRRILSHLIYYVNLGWSATSGTGRRAEWIYALLARVEKPVHRDDAAVLFGLLKNLTLARSKIDFSRAEKDACNLAKLNVLIVLVGVYFEQGSLNKIMSCE
jgi:survival of motor neuron protein-interacting protein 1